MPSDLNPSLYCVIAAALGSRPTVDALQGRITELVDQLERQGPELAAALKERDRLLVVEADLSRTAERLRAEITALTSQHSAELAAVVSAEDTLWAERYAAVAAREAM